MDRHLPGRDGLFPTDIPADVRTAAFDGLFFNLKEKWRRPFWLMLSLGVGTPPRGLSEDSAATVTGAKPNAVQTERREFAFAT
jgi:hypothetical protein